jgi:phosphatidylethanolamine/phosphatidyl-N-methylethanolamine N-methyltransferase
MLMDRSARFYDRLYFLYPLIDIFLKPQKQKFFTLINSNPPGRLLEIGVGNGAHFKYYSTHQVIGIDTSIKMLTRARKLASSNIHVAQMSGEELLFPDESFDYVTLAHVVAVVSHPERLMKEVQRVLKPGGKVFILNHFTPDNIMGRIDRVFARLSKHLHFKSSFQMCDLNVDKFQLLNETNAGLFSYFKILTYEKKV